MDDAALDMGESDPNVRIRQTVERVADFCEQRMFGGICFMVNGHMCCGFAKDRLMLRLGKEGAVLAFSELHVRPMESTGKVMKWMVFIDPKGTGRDEDLARWVCRPVCYGLCQPVKLKKPRRLA